MATTLLLADDSPTIAKILGMALQNDDYAVRSVLTAAEAFQELAANPPRLFLVDLTLPERNGYDFCRLVKSDANLKNTRVVLLASAFEPADPALVTACGADGVISKPFDPAELRASLARALANAPKVPQGGAPVTPPAPAAAPSAADALSLSLPKGSERGEMTKLLMGEAPAAGDANAILTGLLSGNPEPSKLINVSATPSEPPEFSLGDYTPVRTMETEAPPSAPPAAPVAPPSAPPAAPTAAPAAAELDLASSLLSGSPAASGDADPASALLSGLGSGSAESDSASLLLSGLDTGAPQSPSLAAPAAAPMAAPVESAGDTLDLSAALSLSPAEPVLSTAAEKTGLTMSTVQLDMASESKLMQTGTLTGTDEQVLDFSGAFQAGQDGSTAMIDMSAMDSGFIQSPTSPSIKTPAAPTKAPPAPMPKASGDPTKEVSSLSSNAQALAAFFEAEIDSQASAPVSAPAAPAASAPPPAFSPKTPASSMAAPETDEDDSFDDSSIDWGSSPDSSSLNSWSSKAPAAAPKAAPRQEAAAPAAAVPVASRPAPRVETPPPSAAAPTSNLKTNPSGASAAGNFMFDTGGSTFRFSPDYIQRITKSFTGSPEEMILGKDPSAPHTLMFPQESSDFSTPITSTAPAAPAAQAPVTGGTWSPEDIKKMEGVIRQEVQMAVREVLEKVVWEVVPELAENMIRKELEKALKEAEEEE